MHALRRGLAPLGLALVAASLAACSNHAPAEGSQSAADLRPVPEKGPPTPAPITPPPAPNPGHLSR